MHFLPTLLGDIDWTFSQRFAWQDMAVVGLLVVLEGVLSIDNALVLGLLAKRLPREQRGRALSYGIIGAFLFVGSSRVDLQACKLEYSIVSPK